MKKFKVVIPFIIFALLANTVNSQIRISEEIQASKAAKQEFNKLYFVDFWATWCAPCVHAKTYLTTIQKQIPNDFYIVSLTQETPETVKKFLLKRPSELAIAIDYDKETFTKHNIRSLPEGILFNASGKILWKGHPADLKAEDIKRFIRQNDKKVSVSAFINLKAYKRVKEVKTTYEPEEDFELMDSERSSGILDVLESKDYTSYDGNLKSILAFLLSVGDNQVELENDIENKYFKLNIMHDSRKHRNLVKYILKKLKLKMENSTRSGEVVSFTIIQPKFWDTNQIDWGKDNPKYLIDDDQIQADNVSFNEIKYRLANLLEIPVMVEAYENNALHDWQIHYKYYELMQSDLYDNFGIGSEKLIRDYPIYSIQKKAP